MPDVQVTAQDHLETQNVLQAAPRFVTDVFYSKRGVADIPLLVDLTG